VVFTPDGAVGVIADCNTRSGTYTTEGSSITISIGAITQAVCGEEALSDQFIRYLGDVATYVFDNGRLVLNLKVDAGNLIFNNTGSGIIPPQPGEGAPTVRSTEPLNVRTGPGSQYPTYGTAPKGTVFEVIGVSADGEWWVVKLPAEMSNTGDGWIAARYTEASGDINVPVVDPPPLDEIDPPEPAPNTPMATALEPINVRSGPGKEYESYGVASAGDTAEIIGKSADGSYWVVKISTDIAPDGRGWVLAAYVQAENAENVPVIEAP